MKEINIVIDESGTMENNINNPKYTWTNYFMISGYIVDNIGLNKLKSIYLKKELEAKKRNPEYYKDIEEIKGVNIIPSDCAIILKSIIENIKTFTPFSIVVCKNHLLRKKWIENGAFNYFLKILIKFLIENNVITNNHDTVKLYLDNRGRKTPFRNELKEYLEQDLWLDNQDYNFIIDYKDSKYYSYIRCADLISYSILKTHENKSRRDKKIIRNLYLYDINLHKNKTIFPEGTCKYNNCVIIKVYEKYNIQQLI